MLTFPKANAKDENSQTPLHVACSQPLPPIDTIVHLVNSGADVNIADANGWTPLHCEYKNTRTRKKIIELRFL